MRTRGGWRKINSQATQEVEFHLVSIVDVFAVTPRICSSGVAASDTPSSALEGRRLLDFSVVFWSARKMIKQTTHRFDLVIRGHESGVPKA